MLRGSAASARDEVVVTRWWRSNPRGGLHGDAPELPDDLKNVHLPLAWQRVCARVVDRASEILGETIPLGSRLPSRKKTEKPAVYLDDSNHRRYASARGAVWRIGRSAKPGKPPRAPIDLHAQGHPELEVIPAPTRVADMSVLRALVEAAVLEIEHEVAEEETTRPARVRASGSKVEVSKHVPARPETLALVHASKGLLEVWKDADRADRSKRDFQFAYRCLDRGVLENEAARVLMVLPGSKSATRGIGYAVKVVESAERYLQLHRAEDERAKEAWRRWREEEARKRALEAPPAAPVPEPTLDSEREVARAPRRTSRGRTRADFEARETERAIYRRLEFRTPRPFCQAFRRLATCGGYKHSGACPTEGCRDHGTSEQIVCEHGWCASCDPAREGAVLDLCQLDWKVRRVAVVEIEVASTKRQDAVSAMRAASRLLSREQRRDVRWFLVPGLVLAISANDAIAGVLRVLDPDARVLELEEALARIARAWESRYDYVRARVREAATISWKDKVEDARLLADGWLLHAAITLAGDRAAKKLPWPGRDAIRKKLVHGRVKRSACRKHACAYVWSIERARDGCVIARGLRKKPKLEDALRRDPALAPEWNGRPVSGSRSYVHARL